MVSFGHKLTEKSLVLFLLIPRVCYDPCPLFLAKAMVEPPHHACLLPLLPFLSVFYKKNGIVWPRTCQERSLFVSSIMLCVLSLHCWHDIMMGPSSIPLLSDIDIKCHKLLCS
jgi:hypothetical protein